LRSWKEKQDTLCHVWGSQLSFRGMNEEEYCVRGFDLSKRTMQQKRFRRSAMVDAVLNEQNQQRKLSLSDPDRIRYVGRDISESSTRVALRLAASDASEAKVEVSSYHRKQRGTREKSVHWREGVKTNGMIIDIICSKREGSSSPMPVRID